MILKVWTVNKVVFFILRFFFFFSPNHSARKGKQFNTECCISTSCEGLRDGLGSRALSTIWPRTLFMFCFHISRPSLSGSWRPAACSCTQCAVWLINGTRAGTINLELVVVFLKMSDYYHRYVTGFITLSCPLTLQKGMFCITWDSDVYISVVKHMPRGPESACKDSNPAHRTALDNVTEGLHFGLLSGFS